MKEIKLTQGKVALVDDEDYEYLSQWSWVAIKNRNTFYAQRGWRPIIKMHRFIMNPPNDMQIDHIDHNGLNNQKINLRVCTSAQNKMNRRPSGESKYLGVTREGKSNKWSATISHNNQYIHLGAFKTQEEAAIAYDSAAKIYHGEFANLNFKDK